MPQLRLFEARSERDPTWVTGLLPDRSGSYRYVVLIRSPDDPERSPRPVGGRRDRAPHRKLLRTQPDDWHGPLLRLLEPEGSVMTFNALSVELMDKTADITFGTPLERAVWELVLAGELEFSRDAPVLFRRCVSRCLPLQRRPILPPGSTPLTDS